MKYGRRDKETKDIREALRNGDSIDKVCYDYDLTFDELIRLMSSYGSGETQKKKNSSYTGEQYISAYSRGFIIRKGNKYFGRYKTLDDAVTVRDWFIRNRWDKRWVNRACRECNVVRCTK